MTIGTISSKYIKLDCKFFETEDGPIIHEKYFSNCQKCYTEDRKKEKQKKKVLTYQNTPVLLDKSEIDIGEVDKSKN